MSDHPGELAEASHDKTTGLPWPKSWKGAYLLVLSTFVLWVALLIALTESFT